jgi:dihydroxyacetone kinase DhaKLM complex PTS-EIIA-like component DhaM
MAAPLQDEAQHSHFAERQQSVRVADDLSGKDATAEFDGVHAMNTAGVQLLNLAGWDDGRIGKKATIIADPQLTIK